MFELTESLMFQFVFQSKMTFNQFCGKYSVCPHLTTSIVQNTAAARWALHPRPTYQSYQDFTKVCLSTVLNTCKRVQITMCNTDNLWIRNTMASSWQLTRCLVITVGYHRLLVRFCQLPYMNCQSIFSGQVLPVTIYELLEYLFWLGFASYHI